MCKASQTILLFISISLNQIHLPFIFGMLDPKIYLYINGIIYVSSQLDKKQKTLEIIAMIMNIFF